MLSKLADKAVAIIGTGATAIQVVPYLGKYAKQLYVIQRTPSSVDERNNTPTDTQWVEVTETRLAKGTPERTSTTAQWNALPEASRI